VFRKRHDRKLAELARDDAMAKLRTLASSLPDADENQDFVRWIVPIRRVFPDGPGRIRTCARRIMSRAS
jgi:hypothetical protein